MNPCGPRRVHSLCTRLLFAQLLLLLCRLWRWYNYQVYSNWYCKFHHHITARHVVSSACYWQRYNDVAPSWRARAIRILVGWCCSCRCCHYNLRGWCGPQCHRCDYQRGKQSHEDSNGNWTCYNQWQHKLQEHLEWKITPAPRPTVCHPHFSTRNCGNTPDCEGRVVDNNVALYWWCHWSGSGCWSYWSFFRSQTRSGGPTSNFNSKKSERTLRRFTKGAGQRHPQMMRSSDASHMEAPISKKAFVVASLLLPADLLISMPSSLTFFPHFVLTNAITCFRALEGCGYRAINHGINQFYIDVFLRGRAFSWWISNSVDAYIKDTVDTVKGGQFFVSLARSQTSSQIRDVKDVGAGG